MRLGDRLAAGACPSHAAAMNAEIVVTFEATTEMGEQCAHFALFSALPCRHQPHRQASSDTNTTG